ncbi:transcriptional regulator [[Phormidium ambiguum] IAM M-71]|uniref:Transcriptional regulator n=1 Tax=[Phormidium ambiguum] IAM M-71 TaxID=454136 RepID=A0A1U7IP04_9CYAN|nr:helix-turn-helix domain-containing protein [Phormidium ambiguum]OKH39098.1 transcriptional regulator [Phormidium ambiguum IAM M-71]
MSYAITGSCIHCDTCLPLCPTGAIKIVDGKDFWIDPSLCNNCKGYYPQPQCVLVCPVDSPIPLQAKKGRCKGSKTTIPNPDLFSNGKTNFFASAIVVWELCNILTQRGSLPWQTDATGKLYYQRQVNNGQSSITFQITDRLDNQQPVILETSDALATLETFDVRAACTHLIYAAYATSLEQPWQQEFIISDRQIETYLGLDKRKDLNKTTKLALIKKLVQQPCQIVVNINWNQQGKVPGFSLEKSRLWHLLEVQNHFQEDELGCKHLVGLTFKLKAGLWSKYFLNRNGYKNGAAFYQYGALPKSLLTTVTTIWQQHEGAARIMLWLLFKTKMGQEQRITVPTLMRVAYGETKLTQISAQLDSRKRLLRTFESDLEVLNHYGIKPIFDPITYPAEIQPLWAKLADLPDDAEAALEFWINDGESNCRLTDAAPRGKWNKLMNARLLRFELPDDWQKKSSKKPKQKRDRKLNHQLPFRSQIELSGQQIAYARKKLQLSQRALAEQIGKSQSWVRDVERGRFQPTLKDRAILRQILEI